MKITIFVTVALTAVVGMVFADDRFNNWNNNNGWGNDDNGWGNDDGFGGASFGGASFGGASLGGIGHISGGIGSGYGPSYGAGYGSGYGAGYGMGYGSSYGSSYGKGMAQAAYIPVPAAPKAAGGLGMSILPLFFLLFLLPQLFNTSANQDQIILLNSTVSGK
ncbi:uncharacterized protein LOC132729478 [Ruditapes philippinarum]|uniref:uncharacterized protein LOC132729478 n=1 Tax=Ruditapes philippinarum TaxID=129788 RepID=UPI00295AF45B|nr:uncharacterized protein LOC132729478 [Ruditapes philippinarum]XP_060571235.1 uncharacterized protein LOC132729478 [Ruditapes philippinarum]